MRGHDYAQNRSVSVNPRKWPKMSDIFDAAKRSLSADAEREAARRSAQEEKHARQEAEPADRREAFRQASHRLLTLNRQIPDLYAALKRSGIPPSKLEESRVDRLRAKLARPEGKHLADKSHRRGGWPLAEVPLTGRRRVPVGGNAWSGTQYGWRDVVVGGQGIALLTDGKLCEYRRLDSGFGIEIGREYGQNSDLPPEFAVPQALTDRSSGDLIDLQTAAIQQWAAHVEAAMVSLAKKTIIDK